MTSFMALSRGETWYFPGSLLLQTTRCNFHWLGSCWDNGFSPRWGGAIYDTSLASNQLLWSLLGPNPGKKSSFSKIPSFVKISWHASYATYVSKKPTRGVTIGRSWMIWRSPLCVFLPYNLGNLASSTAPWIDPTAPAQKIADWFPP